MSPPPKHQTPAEAGDRAAPAGGPARGWGRAVICLACLVAGAGTQAFASDPPVTRLPSGQEAVVHDVVHDRVGDVETARLRFVAPWIAAFDMSADARLADMLFLCTDYAAGPLAEEAPGPRRIVVTLMEQPTEFGVANPEVVQFFESFRLSDGRCIWEAF